MKRIEKFFKSLRIDFSDSEIAAGLGNGDIEAPEWLSMSEDADHIKAWDSENGGSAQMGFITLRYGDILPDDDTVWYGDILTDED